MHIKYYNQELPGCVSKIEANQFKKNKRINGFCEFQFQIILNWPRTCLIVGKYIHTNQP